MLLLGFALAGIIGLSLGIMGGGGSILAVPVFVYVLGYDPKLAIAMSLPVVGVTSFIGAIGHWKTGNMRLKTAAIFGVIAMAGAFIGARLAVFLSGEVQLVMLAVVMLAAAASMLRSAQRDRTYASDALNQQQPMILGLLTPVAFAVGVITGLVGIGGGFLVVPALVILGRVPMRQAVGTSLLVIALNSLSGFAGYLGTVNVPWNFIVSFTAMSVAGILAGTWLTRFVSQPALKRAFAIFLIVIGTFMLYKNRGAFYPQDAKPRTALTLHTRT